MTVATSQDPAVRISVSLPGRGLFLVVAQQRPLADVVRAFGGRIVTALDNKRALALLEVKSYLALRGSGIVKFIGPVNVDQTRFNAFVSRLSTPATGGTS